MPIQHSNLFSQLTKNHLGAERPQPLVQLNATQLAKQIEDGVGPNYSELVDLLREVNDAQFGIVSSLSGEGEWVRDATHALALHERIPSDSPEIESNNTLMRCLSRLRPIDFAIEKSSATNADLTRQVMQKKFVQLMRYIDLITRDHRLNKTEKQASFDALEKAFNTNLIHALHVSDLASGISDAKSAEKLLFHYRNLSSLLTPARTMVTITYDEVARVYQKETQVPVTKKTELQQTAIQELSTVNISPIESDTTAHTKQKHAMQKADKLFKDMMLSDDTALGAQARKSHLVGAKNAFVVRNEIVKKTDEGQTSFEEAIAAAEIDDIKTLWMARTGSPVYVGNGESSARIQAHTQENLTQIRETARMLMERDELEVAPLAIHITTLNTDSPLQNQSTIIEHLYKATRKAGAGDDISYAPTNDDGTFRLLDVAPTLYEGNASKPWGSSPLNKQKRLESVSKLMRKTSDKPNTLSVVNCASGQDRTGTAVEKTTQDWMKDVYDSWGLNTGNIESMRVRGGNAAEITTHHISGSPGMKTDSQAGKTFSTEASKFFYLSSAKTNKSNPIDDVKFLKIPSDLAVQRFIQHLGQFQQKVDNYNTNDIPQRQQFKAAATDLYQNISKSVGVDISADAIKTKVSAKDLSVLTNMLETCDSVIQRPSDVGAAKQLAGLSKAIPDKGSSILKKIGKSLLFFACAALVTVGILAAIPSGGSSLLLTAIGVIGLTTTTAAAIGGATIAASAAAGGTALHKGQDGQVAKSFKDFKSAYQMMAQDEPDVAEDVEERAEMPLT